MFWDQPDPALQQDMAAIMATLLSEPIWFGGIEGEGYDSVMQLTTECNDIQHAMNHLCWIYIELVASELVDVEEYDEERSMTLIS